MGTTKPTVAIFAENDLLTIYLIDQFLQKGCVVVVITDNPSLWKQGVLALSDNPSLQFFDIRHVNGFKFDYLYVGAGLPGIYGAAATTLRDVEKYIAVAANYAITYHPKVIIVASFILSSNDQQKKVSFLQKNFINIGLKKTVYVGDVYGRGMNFTDSRVISFYLKNIAAGKLPFVNQEHIFPIYVLDAVDNIIRLLFSYWSGAEEIAIANVFTPSQFVEQLPNLAELIPSEEFTAEFNEYAAALQIQAPRHTTDALASTISWIIKWQEKLIPLKIEPVIAVPEKQPQISQTSEVKMEARASKSVMPKLKFDFKFKRPKIKVPKFAIAGITLLIIWLIVVPFVTLGTSVAVLAITYKTALAGNIPPLFAADMAASLASQSKNGFNRLSLDKLSSTAGLIENAALTGKRAILVYEDSAILMKNFFSKDQYDLKSLASKISLELDALYKDASFLQGELKKHPRIESAIDVKRFDEFREYALYAKDIAFSLPDTLASDSRKSYLVLLQNNTELRPTGGFIGSFALLTLENGHMSDLSVYDVYTADGQLKGHVEPPAPIKNYLGEANWYLRDSNWNPDFPASARQAEWFLEKEMERKVEGVISLDLEVLKSLMAYTGEITLPDFGQTVTQQNVYEKIQYEVEQNFFPGSQTKASLLTALSRQILNKITVDFEGQKNQELSKILLDNIQKRHIQFYMHNSTTTRALDSLNWSGAAIPSKCNLENCQNIWLGLAEANVGVNKANYFIKRESSLEVDFSGQNINYSLEVNIENSSENTGSSLGGRYKSYLRVLFSKGAIFEPIEIVDKGQLKKIEPEIYEVGERIEAGVVFEVPPKETRTLRFKWREPKLIDFTKNGSMSLFWRKQAGTLADPIKINIKGTSLTDEARTRYNTILERDFETRLDW